MNSTLFKILIAYIAGIGTYHLFQNHNLYTKLEKMNVQTLSQDTSNQQLAGVAGSTCPCDDAARYNVTPAQSMNVPIPVIADCISMVKAGNPGPTPVGKGAWFSKVTLDDMFCHKPDANGIYVYKAMYNDAPTFVIEAARSDMILTTDDGTSYIYYSRALCPNICGQCGM